MNDRQVTGPLPPSPEATIEEWHDLLDVVLANLSCEVEETVGFLLRTTPSGKAYLARVKQMQPNLEIGEGLSLIDITDTYEASLVVDRLLANSRYGIERDLYIHEFALTQGWASESQDAYPVVIKLLRGEAREDEKRARSFQGGPCRGGARVDLRGRQGVLQVSPKEG